MITIEQFMNIIDYKITEGSEYGWKCYGHNAYRIDRWVIDQFSIGIVFDNINHTVFEVEVCDYKRDHAYRLINPEYIDSYYKEAKERLCDDDVAWDGVKFTDLEVEEDFLEKARAIVLGEDYSTDVQMVLDLADDEILLLTNMANERNITLNELVVNILSEMTNKEVKNDSNS